MTDADPSISDGAQGTAPILVSGASGMIGAALCAAWESEDQPVLRLSRSEAGAPGTIAWQPDRVIDDERLDGLAAAVHLAGAPIAVRWNGERMAAIRGSRVEGTASLSRALAGRAAPPAVLVCASAVGYYGDTGDREVDETAPAGSGFLADVCRGWEAAAAPAREAGIRVVHLRFGLVLDRSGGALAKMVPAFRLGLGGPLGTGRQYVSWIALPDVVRAVRFAIARPELSGPVNVVAPQARPQREFARTLGRVLHRPAWIPVPAVVLRAAFGRMADEALLASNRVRPAVLTDAGFSFRHPGLEDALRTVLS